MSTLARMIIGEQDDQDLRRLVHAAGFLPPYNRLERAIHLLKQMPEYSKASIQSHYSQWFISRPYTHRGEKWRWEARLGERDNGVYLRYYNLSNQREEYGQAGWSPNLPGMFLRHVITPMRIKMDKDKQNFEERLAKIVRYQLE